MPSPDQKQEARLMFLSGRGATEIARTLGLTLRTVQRWFAEWRSGKKPKSKVKPAPIVKAEVLPLQSSPHTSEPTVLGYGGSLQDWVKDINSFAQELRQDHRDARIATKQKYLDELAKNGSNRNIHTLSLALQRHGAEEFKMLIQGRSDLLTLHQALALVQAAGFVVRHPLEDSITQSPKEIEPNDIFSDKLVDTENGSENPEEHGTS